MPGRRPEPLLGSACAIIPSDGSGRAVRPRDPTEPSFGFAEGDSTMTSAKTAVRSLVSGLLRETYTARAPLHLNLRGSRRAGMREAKASSQPRHLDLQRGGGGSGSGINGGSDRSGSADAKSSRTLARQHASMADGHAHAARNSRAADVISAHRDAEDLHRQAAGHYHNASDAYRRGASREAEGHIDRAQAHAHVAHTATQNVSGDGRL